ALCGLCARPSFRVFVYNRGAEEPAGGSDGLSAARLKGSRYTTAMEIDDLLREDRTFPPPADFQARAVVRDESLYAAAERDPDAFWAGFAAELEWSRPWDTVLDWQPPHAKWFV